MTTPPTDTDSAQSELDLPPAHAAFRTWCKEKRGRRLGLARLIGTSASTVGSWGRLSSPGRPREAFHLLVLAEVTGIPVHGWLRPSELARLEPIVQNWQELMRSRIVGRSKVDDRQLHLDNLLAKNADPSDPDDTDLDADESDTDVVDVDAMSATIPAPPDDEFDIDALS